jgi:hypothetical protein
MRTREKHPSSEPKKAPLPKGKFSKRLKRTTEPSLDWSNVRHKTKVFLEIMDAILEDPAYPALGQEYLSSDAAARQAFEERGMKVPPDVKVVFLPAGDSNKLSGGSAVIELPQRDSSRPKPTPDELSELFVANYHIVW